MPTLATASIQRLVSCLEAFTTLQPRCQCVHGAPCLNIAALPQIRSYSQTVWTIGMERLAASRQTRVEMSRSEWVLTTSGRKSSSTRPKSAATAKFHCCFSLAALRAKRPCCAQFSSQKSLWWAMR
ncbi:hypothetical protein AFCDBAGC_1364 [Methylobacterium cerastii]|uniref:Uncharacterized protein n=1 Tax=Methylobacterium cerastii TaxID=932741 RepID=A0ABQ4QE65_9HYPH|nr:hypothetical protein AFCDBAGC_1364 [Methylobacterium cerastii]